MVSRGIFARELPKGTVLIRFPESECRVYIPRLRKWGSYCSEDGKEEGIAVLPRGTNGDYRHLCDSHWGRWYLLSKGGVAEVAESHSSQVLEGIRII